ncbi:MAG TPA: ester cyclase [Chitinophagaceae bacterium]|nr:ester cyclase [Chitinophagaceae bacterium]
MSTQEKNNKKLLADLLAQIDSRDLTNIEAFYHKEYIEHNTYSIKSHKPGIEGVKYGFTVFMEAFEEYTHTIEDMLAEGEKLAARITFSGIFTKPLFNHPPTGERVTATGIAIYTIINGKITEKWGYFNTLQFLGVVS